MGTLECVRLVSHLSLTEMASPLGSPKASLPDIHAPGPSVSHRKCVSPRARWPSAAVINPEELIPGGCLLKGALGGDALPLPHTFISSYANFLSA